MRHTVPVKVVLKVHKMELIEYRVSLVGILLLCFNTKEFVIIQISHPGLLISCLDHLLIVLLLFTFIEFQ